MSRRRLVVFAVVAALAVVGLLLWWQNRVIPEPWRLVGLRDGGRTLILHAEVFPSETDYGCSRYVGTQVRSSEEFVRVEVVSKTTLFAPLPAGCVGTEPQEIVVRLDTPLSDRELRGCHPRDSYLPNVSGCSEVQDPWLGDVGRTPPLDEVGTSS